MKIYPNIVIFAFFISLLISCKNNSTELEKFHKISGTVIYNNSPMDNAKISLDRIINFTTTSDSSGYFEINNVPEGNYTFYVEKTFSNGSFTELNSDILVNSEVILNSLRLPKAVSMFEPIGISSTSIKLYWSSSDASDFREYKLYRHPTSGLDETTGELIHVSTTVNDTSFIDDSLDPVTNYFYRVYVMNDFGRIGGSNIVSALTENQNLIWNGDFELNESLFTWWDDSIGTISITDSIAISGNNSLYLNARIDNNPVQHLNILGYLWKNLYGGNSVNLIPGRKYKLSGWIKTAGECGNEPLQLWGVKASVVVDFHTGELYAISVNEDQDWTYVERDFYVPSESYSEGRIDLLSVSKHTWYDDIKLELID